MSFYIWLPVIILIVLLVWASVFYYDKRKAAKMPRVTLTTVTNNMEIIFWIIFTVLVTMFFVIASYNYARFNARQRNIVLTSTTSNGAGQGGGGGGMVYTIPTTQQLSSSYPGMTQTHSTPVYIMQDVPPSYDQVVNSSQPIGTTMLTTTTSTTIHER